MTRPRRFNVRSAGGQPAFVCMLPATVLQLIRARGTCTLAQLCVDARVYGVVADDDVQHALDQLVYRGEIVRVVLGPHRDTHVAYTVTRQR